MPKENESEERTAAEDTSEKTVWEHKEEISIVNESQSYYQSTEKNCHVEQMVEPPMKSSKKKIGIGICLVVFILVLVCFINTPQSPEQIFTKANEYYDKKDYKKAFDLYLETATKEYAPAQGQLGYMYIVGEGVSQDYKKAFEWFSKSAEQGNVYAQFYLGNMYYDG